MAIPKRVGAFSKEELEFVKENYQRMSPESMGQALNRNTESVKRVLTKFYATIPGAELRKKITGRFYWHALKDQFVDRAEEEFFISLWCETIEQFREDVLSTEEHQIKDLVMSEIYKNRASVARTQELKKLAKLQQQIDIEWEKPTTMRDQNQLQIWEQQAAMSKTAISHYTNDTEKYTKISQDLNKSLKATRDQRFAKVESGNKTFMSIINDLFDEEKREQEGLEAELMRIAIEKKRKELYEYHQYQDGGVDSPIYNVESVEYHKRKDEEENE